VGSETLYTIVLIGTSILASSVRGGEERGMDIRAIVVNW